MKNPLIKKQFTEMFKTYFVNAKTGEKRTKVKTVLLFCLFAFLMIFVSASFFAMSGLFIDLLKADSSIHWLYFAIMGILALFLAVFGSVFNTYASVYLAKDNELLLSLPIPPGKILASRIIGVYGLSLLYGSVVWLPVSLFYVIFGKPTAAAIIFEILLIFILPLFASVLTLALGFVVALISGRLKNKSITTVLITLAAMGGYYFVWFRMTDTLKSIVTNSEATGKAIKKWANLFYIIGKSATGDFKSFALFTVLSVVLFALCMFILSKTFIRITTMNKGAKREKVNIKSEKKQKKVSAALLAREFKKFSTSAVYMLNCALGTVIAPVIAVIVLFKRQAILTGISVLRTSFNVDAFLPVGVAALIIAVLGMNAVTTPSISLEGKNLWILKSLPVSAADIYKAKINTHLILTAPLGITAAVITGFALKLGITSIVMICALAFVISEMEAGFGLMLNIKRPNFNWTTETTPIKQSLNALFYVLVTWLIPIIMIGVFILIKMFTSFNINPDYYLLAFVFIFAALTYLINNWIYKKGVELFEEF